MKEVRQYICLVDAYRRPSRRRNTAGRYRVAAKSPKEAVKLLRAKIGFGSIQVYYDSTDYDKPEDKLSYKSVVREFITDKKGNVKKFGEALHANALRK
jgi:hypothetical protein